MSDITKIKVSRVLFSSWFWVIIFVAYFQSRGIELSTIFTVLSIYQISIVLLEYPTGVFSDIFSHRKSLILGYFIFSLSFFLLGLPGGIFYYSLIMLLHAIATTLVSGCDDAFLYSKSNNFRKDLTSIKSIAIIWTAISASIGSFIGKYDLSIPFFLSSLAFFITALLILSTKEPKKESKQSGNIFSELKRGFDVVLTNNQLFYFVGLTSLLGGFFIGAKWWYNPYFETLNIDVFWWGAIFALATIVRAFGIKLVGSLSKNIIPLSVIATLVTILITGFVQIPLFALIGFIGFHFLRGFTRTQIDLEINHNIKNNSERARVLSIGSLMERLISAGYIALAGFILGSNSFTLLMALSTGLIAIIFIALVIKSKLISVPKQG